MCCRWSYNPNSDDTGGLVENDWKTIVWEKIDFLTQLGLEPWYLEIQDLLSEAAIVQQNNTLYDDVAADAPRVSFVFPRKPARGSACLCVRVNTWTCQFQGYLKHVQA